MTHPKKLWKAILLTLASVLFCNFALAQKPSSLDIELQQNGILDRNFKYTESPQTYELYRNITAYINKSTPIEMGDGVRMIQALQMPYVDFYTYSVPFDSKLLTKKQISQQKQIYLPMITSTFCQLVQKHMHYKVNNRRQKYIYYDQNGFMYMEVNLQAKEC